MPLNSSAIARIPRSSKKKGWPNSLPRAPQRDQLPRKMVGLPFVFPVSPPNHPKRGSKKKKRRCITLPRPGHPFDAPQTVEHLPLVLHPAVQTAVVGHLHQHPPLLANTGRVGRRRLRTEGRPNNAGRTACARRLFGEPRWCSRRSKGNNFETDALTPYANAADSLGLVACKHQGPKQLSVPSRKSPCPLASLLVQRVCGGPEADPHVALVAREEVLQPQRRKLGIPRMPRCWHAVLCMTRCEE